MEHMIPNAIENWGLGTALSAGVFIAFFFLLKWVLQQSSDQLKIMSEERKAWREMQYEFAERLRELQTNNMLFHSEVKEAHKFQREEHQEMITCLGRINGYKH